MLGIKIPENWIIVSDEKKIMASLPLLNFISYIFLPIIGLQREEAGQNAAALWSARGPSVSYTLCIQKTRRLWDCEAPMRGLACSVNQCTAGRVIASDLPGACAIYTGTNK